MINLIATFDRQYRTLHENSCLLIERVPKEKLFILSQTKSQNFSTSSFGENILRSAGAVEQTFGGITCNLWDDPFEWTLPETLSTNEKLIEYLNEVEETRNKGFTLLKDDEVLKKEIPNAAGELTTLFVLLIETLVSASHYQGRAFAIAKTFEGVRLPRC